jgi:hypothetical protein
MRIKDLITSRICGNTVFENSWLWYCDDCRQHGTAMSAEEADFMGNAHVSYHSYSHYDWDKEYSEDEDMEEAWEANTLYYATSSQDERDIFVWENDMCIVYIIDEGNNITYDLGDDYEDKTPNQVSDLDTMIKLQKDLGLE